MRGLVVRRTVMCRIAIINKPHLRRIIKIKVKETTSDIPGGLIGIWNGAESIRKESTKAYPALEVVYEVRYTASTAATLRWLRCAMSSCRDLKSNVVA